MQKIGVIGCGMVGMSYVYAMVQSGLDLEIVLIDMNKEVLDANVMDVEDALPLVNSTISIKAGDYADLNNADLLVITAGRPQKPGESRPEMIKDNSLIMKEIARRVKESGFAGITIVASNPVDALTFVYQAETKYDRNRVIGSGTVLDSARLVTALARKCKVRPREVNAMLIGEHGETSVFISSLATVKEKSMRELLETKKLKKKDLDDAHQKAVKKAGIIIKGKRATYYGIGNALSYISLAILKNKRIFAPIGTFVAGMHGAPDVVMGYPVTVDGKGVEHLSELVISKEEKDKFIASGLEIKKSLEDIGYLPS